MASGEKSSGVFTRNSIEKGKSEGIKTKSTVEGQRIMSPYPMDNVHGVDLPDTMGGKMGGSVTNLKHSLTGVSAVQDGPGATTPVKHIIRKDH